MISSARSTALRQLRASFPPPRLSTVQSSLLSRLLSTLAVLEQRNGKLNISSLGAITAAKKLGGSITGFIAGSGVSGVAKEAAKVDGVEKIIAVENPDYEKARSSKAFAAMLTSSGTAGKLRSAAGGEHQEGRIYARRRWALRLRKKPPSSSCCASRLPADIRCDLYRERGQ